MKEKPKSKFSKSKHSNKQSTLKVEVEKFIEKLRKVQDQEFRFWKENVSEEITNGTIPLYIKNDVFFVHVPDPVKRFELSRSKQIILNKIINNQNTKIKDIVFI